MRANQIAYAHMLRKMQDGGATVREMMDASGLHKDTVGQFLRCLHKQQVVHIARYNTDSRGRNIERVWALGNAPDAPRKRFTAAEITQRCRDKKKALALQQ